MTPVGTVGTVGCRLLGTGCVDATVSIRLSPTAGRVLTTTEIRQHKLSRTEFVSRPRRPITLVLDGVRQNSNLGAIFRLCDAFLVKELVICGTQIDLRSRKLVQAARGSHHWVPWAVAGSATDVVGAARASGMWVLAVEQTTRCVELRKLQPHLPAVVVLGSEGFGIAQEVIDRADCAVSIPMLGMANSLNVATAAAIILYELGIAADREGTAQPVV